MQTHRTEPLFLPAPFYIIRAPVLSFQAFDQLHQDAGLAERLIAFFRNDSFVREAVLVASPELYRALQGFEQKSDKQKKEVASSLLKYLLRMTSRPTPFGLFSFVASGQWGERTKNSFERQKLRKRARPDMEWLMKVIDVICEDAEAVSSLLLRANPLLFQSSGRIQLNYLRKREATETKTDLSVRATPLVRAILKAAQKPLLLIQLQKELLDTIPGLDTSKTKKVIEQLLAQDILQFYLAPSLLTESPYEDLLSKINECDFKFCKTDLLKKIQIKLNEYNSRCCGLEGENLLRDLYRCAEEVTASKHYLQVDMAATEGEFCLPKGVAEQVTEAVELLWGLSGVATGYAVSTLRDYHTQFVEKYGYARRVSLLDLLDDRGLGAPKAYLETRSDSAARPAVRSLWDEWLRNQCFLCFRDHKQEIVLDELTLERLIENKPDKKRAPLSFDLFCQIIAESAEKIDEGQYDLYLMGNTLEGGTTCGRFLDLLGVETIKQLAEFYRCEEKLESRCEFVEISYYPDAPRASNVAVHPSLRKYSLNLALEPTGAALSLDQIYVGALQEGFYLTNREGSREWIFRAGNVLRSQMSPTPLRFLRDVSASRYQPLQSVIWANLGTVPFLPRIKFKKIILCAAQWFINPEMLEIKNINNFLEIETKLKAWMDYWGMPKLLLLAEGDNQLLVDRRCEAHLKEIISKLKQGTTVHLLEKMGQDTHGQWLCSSAGPHCSELVISFLKNPSYHATLPPRPPKYADIQETVRQKLPGSEWLFVKLYISEDYQEKFLLNILHHFATRYVQQGVVTKWFFVRYSDQRFHLRVRFRGEPQELLQTLIPAMHDWSVSLIEEKLLYDLQIGTYEREVERYGGESMIEVAEEFFCADTETATYLLSMAAQGRIGLPIHVIAAISLIDLLRGFGYALANETPGFLTNGAKKEELKGIRPWRKILASFAQHTMSETLVAMSTDEADAICEALSKRKNSLRQLSEGMREFSAKGELLCSPESLQNSIIHMHCNRLMGVDPHLEHKARLYADYALALQTNLRVPSFDQTASSSSQSS